MIFTSISGLVNAVSNSATGVYNIALSKYVTYFRNTMQITNKQI